jgi:hypothetical protein
MLAVCMNGTSPSQPKNLAFYLSRSFPHESIAEFGNSTFNSVVSVASPFSLQQVSVASPFWQQQVSVASPFFGHVL